MKYQQLAPMPLAVSDWLEEHFDLGGMDAVEYTCDLLNLLQDATVDVIQSDEDLQFSYTKKIGLFEAIIEESLEKLELSDMAAVPQDNFPARYGNQDNYMNLAPHVEDFHDYALFSLAPEKRYSLQSPRGDYEAVLDGPIFRMTTRKAFFDPIIRRPQTEVDAERDGRKFDRTIKPPKSVSRRVSIWSPCPPPSSPWGSEQNITDLHALHSDEDNQGCWLNDSDHSSGQVSLDDLPLATKDLLERLLEETDRPDYLQKSLGMLNHDEAGPFRVVTSSSEKSSPPRRSISSLASALVSLDSSDMPDTCFIPIQNMERRQNARVTNDHLSPHEELLLEKIFPSEERSSNTMCAFPEYKELKIVIPEYRSRHNQYSQTEPVEEHQLLLMRVYDCSSLETDESDRESIESFDCGVRSSNEPDGYVADNENDDIVGKERIRSLWKTKECQADKVDSVRRDLFRKFETSTDSDDSDDDSLAVPLVDDLNSAGQDFQDGKNCLGACVKTEPDSAVKTEPDSEWQEICDAIDKENVYSLDTPDYPLYSLF